MSVLCRDAVLASAHGRSGHGGEAIAARRKRVISAFFAIFVTDDGVLPCPMARRSEAPRSRPPNPSGVGLSDRAGLHRRLGWADRQRPSRSGGPENDGPFAVERPWLASEDRPQGRSLPAAGRKH